MRAILVLHRVESNRHPIEKGSVFQLVAPIWVDLPCAMRTLQLPLDAATASLLQRWFHLDRQIPTVWIPISTTLWVAAFAVI